MRKIIFFLFILVSIGSCQFVKYYDEYGITTGKWGITEYPTRPCRAEEGWHRCTWYGYDYCIIRMLAFYCDEQPQLNCNPEYEIEILMNENTTTPLCVPRYRIREFLGFENAYLPCRANEFECKFSKRCIPRHFVQDGEDDCSDTIDQSIRHKKKQIVDHSDETDFLSCFEETEFSCSSSKKSRCISRNKVMDGIIDCPNGEDEKTTVYCFNRTEFLCPHSARCILRRHVNDNFTDCPGNQDEMVKNFVCIDQLEFSCDKVNGIGRCIPKEWVRNGIEDCSNGEDEEVVEMECADGKVKCLDNMRCIPSEYICDGVQHCLDGSDEVELCNSPTMYRYKPQRLMPWSFLLLPISTINRYFDGFQPKHDLVFGLKCYVTTMYGEVSVKLRTVPQFGIFNNISICSDNEDKCFYDTFTCARCLDGTVISKQQVCDNVIDCKDMSDECLCENSKVKDLCENVFSFHNDTNVSKWNIDMICNGNVDAVDGLDEIYCNREVLSFTDVFSSDRKSESKDTNFRCSTRDLQYYQDSNKQLYTPLYCDGNFDCPFMEDECSSACLTQNFQNKTMKNCFPFLVGPVEVIYGYGHTYSYNVSYTDDGNEMLYSNINNKHNESSNLTICEYELFHNYYDGTITSRNSRSIPSGEALCMSYRNHWDLNFLCEISGVKCPWLHVCDGKKKIEISRRCDSRIDCIDKSDEEECPSNFYCSSGSPWFIPRSLVNDGHVDCSDHSDERGDKSYMMLKSSFLCYFVWIFAFAIIIANCVSLGKKIQKIKKNRSKRSIPFSNLYLLVVLATSNMLFGFILLTIGIKSQQFSGNYDAFDLEWRTSLSCNVIGMLTVISSQTPVNLLVLISGLQFYITYFPQKLKGINFNLLVILSSISIGTSIILASFPMWGNFNFTSSFYINRNLFFNHEKVSLNRVESYMRETEVVASLTNFSCSNFTESGLETSFPHKLESWFFNSEKGREEFPNRQIDIRGSLGFYSSSSICFPDYFAKTAPASEYSLFIVLLNLASFLLVLIGYILVFYRTRKSTYVQTADEENAHTEVREMTRRMFFIVVTDFIFWLPIIITRIIISCFSLEYEMPEIVQTALPIVFISINSLKNPVICSKSDNATIRNLKKFFCPSNESYDGGEVEDHDEQQIPMQAIDS